MPAIANDRFTLWVVSPDHGLTQRDAFSSRWEAIASARKYWLTTALTRAFVCDSGRDGAVVFNRALDTAGKGGILETYGCC
jgi:hypothetical protein